jgi:hypothetical protein
MPLKLSWDERCAEDAEGPVRLWRGAQQKHSRVAQLASVAVSEAVGYWFESSLGNHSGVVQWQDGDLWSRLRVFDSLHRNHQRDGLLVSRLLREQEAAGSTPYTLTSIDL